MGFTSPTRKGPGFDVERESIEVQVWAPGRDNNHSLFDGRTNLAAGTTDSGNSPDLTTIRGGNIVAVLDDTGGSDPFIEQLGGLYSDTANNGLQCAVGVLDQTFSMLNSAGTASQEHGKALVIAHLKANELTTETLSHQSAAQLWRRGFTLDGDTSTVGVFGAAFGVHPICSEIMTASRTLTHRDNGRELITEGTFLPTMPVLATVGAGFQVDITSEAGAAVPLGGELAVGGSTGAAATATVTLGTNAKARLTATVLTGGTLKYVVEALAGNVTVA